MYEELKMSRLFSNRAILLGTAIAMNGLELLLGAIGRPLPQYEPAQWHMVSRMPNEARPTCERIFLAETGKQKVLAKSPGCFWGEKCRSNPRSDRMEVLGEMSDEHSERGTAPVAQPPQARGQAGLSAASATPP